MKTGHSLSAPDLNPHIKTMNQPVADTIHRLLDLTNQPPQGQNDIDQLVALLDELAFLSHRIAYEFDETEYSDPPEKDLHAYLRIAQAWVPKEVGEFPLDATVDLAELLMDMADLKWRFDHTSEDDALFYFELGYRSHWGHHLRGLQKSLHEWLW